MLAQLQRFTTLNLLLTATCWAFWAWNAGHPGWALGGAALILLGYALVLGMEFLAMHLVNRTDPAPRASWGQVLGAWLNEVRTAPLVFCWQQPFRSRAIPDQTVGVAANPTRHPTIGVVFVHGFICNRGVWNPWLRRLKDSGIPFIAVNLEPVFGSIDQYTPAIESAVQRLSEITGHPPVVMAHSMGGLAVRAWLSEFQALPRIRHVITIGSPHQGTWLSRFGVSPNTKQMREGSPWLIDLVSSESLQTNIKFTCFYSHCDNIVFPASNACLTGAKNIHLEGYAHVQMTHHEDIFQELLRLVDPGKTSKTNSGTDT